MDRRFTLAVVANKIRDSFYLSWYSKRRLLLISGCSLALATLITWFQVSLQSALRRNSLEALFLTSELRSETGHNIPATVKIYSYMLERHITRMEGRLPWVYRELRPKCDPRKGLGPALEVLQAGAVRNLTEEEYQTAVEIIRSAGVTWCKMNEDAFSLEIGSRDDRWEIVREALVRFEESVVNFQSRPTLENAESACMNSRFASAALLNNWSAFQAHKKDLKNFETALKRLHTAFQAYGDSLPPQHQAEVSHHAQHLQHYSQLVSILQSEGILKGQNYLLATLRKPPD